MPRRDDRVLIAGGGIGGLAAAIALGRRGVAVDVLERSNFTEETGAGIQLGPNATRALVALGILDAIEPLAFRPEEIRLYDGISGGRLASVPLGVHVERRYGAPYLTLHRADFHAALRAAAGGLGSVALIPGFEVAAIEEGEAGPVAKAPDGREAKGSWIIGADGLWSTLRALVAPEARLRFTGATAWRALLPRAELPSPFDAPIVGLWLGPGCHIVHYPVRAGDALNIVAVMERGGEREGWNRTARPETVLASFAHWTEDARALLERAESWRGWSLYRLSRLKRWSAGSITLLGDAAHPVLPFLAQGAALAIEDAAFLAACLGESPGKTFEAARRYERIRLPRAARVERNARRLGALYHLRGPLRVARNVLLRRQHEERTLQRFDWLYRQVDPV